MTEKPAHWCGLNAYPTIGERVRWLVCRVWLNNTQTRILTAKVTKANTKNTETAGLLLCALSEIHCVFGG